MRKATILFITVSFLLAGAALPGFSEDGNLLIKNGTILTVTKGAIPRGDILIMNGIIKEIGLNIAPPRRQGR